MTDEREYWQVQIALDPEEWDAVRRAMFPLAPSERWNIALKAGEDGEAATLEIDVLAAAHGEAEDLAEALSMKARREAGLPARAPLMLGVRTPWFGPEPYHRLLEEARRLIEADRHELAVIRVQTACEVFAEATLEVLTRGLRQPDEKVTSLFPNLSLLDRRARALLQALTGSAIHEEDWWPTYRGHVQRRNSVVHDRLHISKDEAEASQAAARCFIQHLGWLSEGQPADPFASHPVPSDEPRD